MSEVKTILEKNVTDRSITVNKLNLLELLAIPNDAKINTIIDQKGNLLRLEFSWKEIDIHEVDIAED